jgi:16S rRNA (uracil1498-N3)-methyltransferase
MLHVYVRDTILGDLYVIFDKEQLHHLTVVLRARHGESISLFDPQGNAYHGSISQITRTELKVQIDSRQLAVPSKLKLTVACAIPKASGMDDVIDHLTQLGVDSIIPMITERVVAKPYEPEKKLERWRKIALNASEQSQRITLPEVHSVLGMTEVIQMSAEYTLKLIPTLEGPTKPLNAVLRNFDCGQIVVLIGPEGDFSPEEVKTALRAGFSAVSLGNNVLRVESAAAAVAAVIKLSLPEPSTGGL